MVQNDFNKHIDTNFPFLKKKKLLLAVSAGIDSVALVHMCCKAELDIALAHCNFKLRALDSDSDQDFVVNLAHSLNLEVFTQSFDTEGYAKKNKCSIQMAARELRYQWFEELQKQLGFDYLLTAHHADDNFETFLINLLRGSGLEGLSGIPELSETVVRPILQFSRSDIKTYVHSNSISWREDSSNASVKYLRNKLRHEVIPILKDINPQLLQNFKKTIAHLKESQDIVGDRIDAVSEEVLSVHDSSITLSIKVVESFNNPKAYLYEFLKDYGFTEWRDLTKLLDAQTGKYIESDYWRLLKNRDKLILSERKSLEFKTIEITNINNPIIMPHGTLVFSKVDKISATDINSIFVDSDLLNLPLTIRVKKPGDTFVPFGMNGSKKLSKFFKDEKYSIIEKEKILVLCSADEIVWIIGKRADDRYKITESTKAILKISLQ